MMNNWNRREFIAAGAAASVLPGLSLAAPSAKMLTKPIPASGELLPVVGLGTYEVFDVESTPGEIATRHEIVERLVSAGGKLLDTSPMYNRSEKVIGDVTDAGVSRDDLFLATKVWTDGREAGIAQMNRSADLMNTAGAQAALGREMQTFKPQFIQINYSLGEREAEQRLLPLAQEMGVAVLINRPFQSGRLFRAIGGKELPDFAREFAESWGQFFLKFIISHPAVTCAIPATSKPHHMADNLGAGFGKMPDSAMRQRMVDYFDSL